MVYVYTSSQYSSMWCIVQCVICVGVAHSTPGDSRLVGSLPLRPVVDIRVCEEVVASSQGRLKIQDCYALSQWRVVLAKYQRLKYTSTTWISHKPIHHLAQQWAWNHCLHVPMHPILYLYYVRHSLEHYVVTPLLFTSLG